MALRKKTQSAGLGRRLTRRIKAARRLAPVAERNRTNRVRVRAAEKAAKLRIAGRRAPSYSSIHSYVPTPEIINNLLGLFLGARREGARYLYHVRRRGMPVISLIFRIPSPVCANNDFFATFCIRNDRTNLGVLSVRATGNHNWQSPEGCAGHISFQAAMRCRCFSMPFANAFIFAACSKAILSGSCQRRASTS